MLPWPPARPLGSVRVSRRLWRGVWVLPGPPSPSLWLDWLLGRFWRLFSPLAGRGGRRGSWGRHWLAAGRGGVLGVSEGREGVGVNHRRGGGRIQLRHFSNTRTRKQCERMWAWFRDYSCKWAWFRNTIHTTYYTIQILCYSTSSSKSSGSDMTAPGITSSLLMTAAESALGRRGNNPPLLMGVVASETGSYDFSDAGGCG